MTLKARFDNCETYPCVLYRFKKLGTYISLLYIYDTLTIRDKTALMDTIEFIKKKYLTQSTGPLEDFVGCTIKCDLTKMTLNISQTHIITKIPQVFNNDVKLLMNFNTPDISHGGTVCNKETDTKISNYLQKIYRGGNGSLIYLVNHSCPKLYNAVRELSKCM